MERDGRRDAGEAVDLRRVRDLLVRVARDALLGEDLEPGSRVAERPRRQLDPLRPEGWRAIAECAGHVATSSRPVRTRTDRRLLDAGLAAGGLLAGGGVEQPPTCPIGVAANCHRFRLISICFVDISVRVLPCGHSKPIRKLRSPSTTHGGCVTELNEPAGVFARERQEHIARLVEEHGRVRVSDLAGAVRRLARSRSARTSGARGRGQVVRTHGGAIVAGGEPSGARLRGPRATPADEKAAIGAAAAAAW